MTLRYPLFLCFFFKVYEIWSFLHCVLPLIYYLPKTSKYPWLNKKPWAEISEWMTQHKPVFLLASYFSYFVSVAKLTPTDILSSLLCCSICNKTSANTLDCLGCPNRNETLTTAVPHILIFRISYLFSKLLKYKQNWRINCQLP